MNKKNTKWQPMLEQAVGIINSDNKIEVKEIDELYQLFFLLNYSADNREKILKKIIDKDDIDIQSFSPELKNYNKNERFLYVKEIMKFKDLQEGENDSIKNFVESLQKKFKITPKTLKFINELIGKENKLYDIENWDEETVIDVISNFGAIGIPLTALYFFGITGLSGAGILSGLAEIGAFFGTFGVSPAVGGIIMLMTMSGLIKINLKSKIGPEFLKMIKNLFKKKSRTEEDIVKMYMEIRNNIELDMKRFQFEISDIGTKHFFTKNKLARVLKKLYKIYFQRIEKLQKIGEKNLMKIDKIN